MTSPEAHEPTLPTGRKSEFSAAEIGALAHLYRGEVYRSTIWRTRLDSSSEASPLPMVLVGLLVSVFLLFEARRYRYFNVWRARARLLETDFYAPMIRGEGVRLDKGWTELLAKDYVDPRYQSVGAFGALTHGFSSFRLLRITASLRFIRRRWPHSRTF